MANNLKARPMDAIIQEFASKGFGPATIRFMQDLAERNDKSLTNLGNMTTQAGMPSSDQVLADGVSTLRRYQQSGALNLIDNAGFEAALINGQIPGWSVGSAKAIALDAGAPQAGNFSLKVTFTQGGQAANAAAQYFARPGDTFRISGWLKSDGVSTPFLRLTFVDKNGAFLGAAGTPVVSLNSFQFVQASLQAPANTVAAVVWLQSNTAGAAWFDSLQASRTLTSFEITPINTAGVPRSSTGLVSQVGVTTAMSIASSTWQFGDGQPAYNTGSSDPGVLGTYAVTGDDTSFSGGAIPYIPRSTLADANAANGRLLFGNITTVGGGAAVSTGGGTGGGGPKSKAALA